MPLKKTVGQLTKIQLPLRRLRPLRFSGSLRIRENSLTLFLFFSLFTLILYFFFFLFFPALRRVDFFEKMALMLNFIKAMKELSVISWEGGVILWAVKLLKKPATTMSALVKPSSLIPKGLRVQQINNLTLFKFTDELGDRMQTLLDKKKADDLTPEEVLELEAIGELDQIFSYINAVIAARVNGHS
ncbi:MULTISPECIES: hypothetical protein [Microcystis]|jgi:hypothetical protein|uniref:Uncharacterized protein n=2 Tax=Microcystis aeruginosa TaxID=1126 RepID=A0A402D7P3_MICAE|nr:MULTISPECIES: hypothetical protein [Microcystis]GCE58210.1 hypothetical protein MiAbB_00115 [Microcystis aeruginosa NIES-4285]